METKPNQVIIHMVKINKINMDNKTNMDKANKINMVNKINMAKINKLINNKINR